MAEIQAPPTPQRQQGLMGGSKTGGCDFCVAFVVRIRLDLQKEERNWNDGWQKVVFFCDGEDQIASNTHH